VTLCNLRIKEYFLAQPWQDGNRGGGMTRKEIIVKAIRTASVNDRLTCEKAHSLANELKVPLKEIGSICNEIKIKITACQLGCF
jgi:hypothetical protein